METEIRRQISLQLEAREEARRADLRELGDILHNRRVDLRLSARKAAKLADISYAYLLALEKGSNPKTGLPSRPTFEVLARIDDALNLSGETFELAGYSSPQPRIPPEQSYVERRREEKRLNFHLHIVKTVFNIMDDSRKQEMLGDIRGIVGKYTGHKL